MVVSNDTGVNICTEMIAPPGPACEARAVMLVQNELGPEGLVSVHLLSGQKDAFEKAKLAWWNAVPWESADYAHYQEYEEAGIWHFLLYWPLRGLPVKMDWTNYELNQIDGQSTPKDDMFILWILAGKSERLSEAIEAAIWRYLAWFGEWPDIAWVGQKFHKFSGKTVKVRDQEIIIEAVDWLMTKGVGVGIAENTHE